MPDAKERELQKKDPTEDVMAAIARIVENPSSRIGPGKTADAVVQSPATQALAATSDGDEDQGTAQGHTQGNTPVLGAHGYSRLGPGPLPALRFKWTARRDAGGDHYVDETIGEYSRPVTTGPMTAEESIAFVDKQVKDARERFDRLKADMSVKAPEADSDPDAGA